MPLPPTRGRVAPDLRAVARRRLRGLLGLAGTGLDDTGLDDTGLDGAGLGGVEPVAEPPGAGAAPSARPRFGLDGRAALVPAVLALGAVVLGLVLLWRARPSGVDVGPPAYVVRGVPTSSSAALEAGSAGKTPPPGLLVVDVQGRVRHPGVVRLPAGSRVLDALRAAGGPRGDTATTSLNLARPLVDGEQVVLAAGGAAAAPALGGTATVAGPVDLNAATLADLDALPGVGPVLAQRILDFRTEHGRFTAVEELGEVPGIGPAKFEALKRKVRV